MNSSSRATILIVDDRPENLLALEGILETLECDLVRADSGVAALKHLMQNDFALILLDVQMPGLDGFETATLIKDRERTRHIPIIFVTALSTEEAYVFKGYSAGAVDYLAKPYNPDILRSKVAVFIELWQKSEQIKTQSELLRQSEARDAEALARDRERKAEQRHIKQLQASEASLRIAKEEAETAREVAEEARETAERASRAKSDFISGVSHELRTPLNAIIGFSKLLLNPRVGPLNESQESYIADVVQGAEHLLQIINDILDLSKIEAGKMSLEMDGFSLAELLHQSTTVVRDQASAQNLQLGVELAPEVEALPEVEGDSRKIRQVLFNLLSNAVKFTPEGGSVKVGARLVFDKCEMGDIESVDDQVSQAKADWCVEIAVEDSGIGVPEEHRERIFGAFEQVDSSYARSQQGTGLGLPLTRRIVELHGGRIWMESGAERGSIFKFTLPLHAAMQKAAA